jgi:hypothetical protein
MREKMETMSACNIYSGKEYYCGKDSCQDILNLFLVSDKQITFRTVTADLIQRYWLFWAYMNEQQEIGVACIGISNNDIDLRYRVIE